MAIYAAQKGQLWIPYGEGIYTLQYYVAPFSITNTSYGSGSYGYGSYGSTVASGTTPTWGVSTASIQLVRINDVVFSSTTSLALCESTPSSFYYDSSAQILYINTDLIYTHILYPDMKNSPTWYKTQTWVKQSGDWKKASVWIKVSGIWTKVA